MRVVAAMDKFRGTATAREAASAVAAACWELGVDVDEVPLSDGGEGILDVLGGANRTTIVTGPLGTPVEAGWRLSGRTAVIEMATASGLLLAGGPEGNDALGASTRGTGELIAKAIELGAKTIIVGLGGSATTDGGLGAIEALGGTARIGSIDLQVACDVRTTFVDAAPVFASQKGATPAQVGLLRARLEQLADRYRREYGVDVRTVAGAGAAGGLAGGLLAIGGRLLPGFDLVADHTDLYERIAGCDVAITGEGYLDAQSLDGKVVGGVLELAAGKPVIVIAGDADTEAIDHLTGRAPLPNPQLGAPRSVDAKDRAKMGGRVSVVSLVERFGEQRAMREPRWCIEHAACDELGRLSR